VDERGAPARQGAVEVEVGAAQRGHVRGGQ
jgi:hypothetical protein